jgi:hypothetical protein
MLDTLTLDILNVLFVFFIYVIMNIIIVKHGHVFERVLLAQSVALG